MKYVSQCEAPTLSLISPWRRTSDSWNCNMMLKKLCSRQFQSERMVRAKKKNHSVLIGSTGILFLVLCWNFKPPSQRPNNLRKNLHTTEQQERHIKVIEVESAKDALPEISNDRDHPHEQHSDPFHTTGTATDVDSDNRQSGYTLPGVNGGLVFNVPASWNRLHAPWFQPDAVKLLTPKESNHRYLYAATRISTSDGIGHSMGVVNRDFNFAISLKLTYTHRVGTYSSLTFEDKNAVEAFFGWGSGEVPRTKIQQEGCVPQGGSWPEPNHTTECHICEHPRASGALGIQNLVEIPADMRSNCLHPDDPCQKYRKRFLNDHQESHTIFQASRKACSPPATDNNFLVSKSLFFHKYWDQHGLRPWHPQNLATQAGERPIRYKPEELNVAIHIRRGDFLIPETQAKRGITKDEVFAKVLINALSVVQKEGGVFSEMPIVVHIYSEGRLQKGSVLSIHMIELQDNLYYDSSGTPRNAIWWKGLILKTLSRSNAIELESLKERLTVLFHISEDTLLCLHEMVSADIFIGSKSGLSNALVWSVSRGVVLIPYAPTINIEKGKKGNVCCSIPFTNEDGIFDTKQFSMYWNAYSQANSESASKAFAR